MLDSLDLTLAISKRAFKPVLKQMEDRLFELSELVYEQKRPAIIVFEGWDAAGKGTSIRTLTERLDARGYKVLPTQAARTHEKMKPWLWRFWMNIPRHGQIAIFDRSWYGRVLVERVEGLTSLPEWIAAYEEINNFERTLADDGTVFVKFWLHISKEEQLRRFIDLTQHPETAWQVAAEDWEHHRKYDEYLAAVRDMLANTHRPPHAAWTVVPATDRDYRLYTVFHTIIGQLEDALQMERLRWPEPEDLRADEAEEEKGKKKKEKVKTPDSPVDERDANSKKKKKKNEDAPPESPVTEHAANDKKKKKKDRDTPLESPVAEYAANDKRTRRKTRTAPQQRSESGE